MDNILNKIESDINESLANMSIIVTKIEYVKEGKYNFLKIELDKVNGLDIDTIVEATHIIDPIVDKYDFGNDSYILDIVSKESGEE